MASAVVDRRVLRAFYTQYVAVLLIVLVFSIAGARNTGIKQRIEPKNQLPIAALPTIGARIIRDPFQGGDGVVLGDVSELEAIAEALSSHDIRAVFTITAPRADRFQEIELQRAVRKAALVRDFFILRGLPTNSVRLVVSDDVERPANQYAVVFESMESRDG